MRCRFWGCFWKTVLFTTGPFYNSFSIKKSQPAGNFAPVLFQASEKCFGLFFLLFFVVWVIFWWGFWGNFEKNNLGMKIVAVRPFSIKKSKRAGNFEPIRFKTSKTCFDLFFGPFRADKKIKKSAKKTQTMCKVTKEKLPFAVFLGVCLVLKGPPVRFC